MMEISKKIKENFVELNILEKGISDESLKIVWKKFQIILDKNTNIIQ